MAKMTIIFEGDDGKVQTVQITDTDRDGKPEFQAELDVPLFGAVHLGPHESPVAIPDLTDVLQPILKKVLPVFGD